jgi:uncharacterized protein
VTGAGPVALRTGDGRLVAGRVAQGLGFRARFMGLMGRPSLAPDEGLYLPDSSIHMCFMRFPIDALFVSGPDAGGRRRAVAVRPDLPPWRGLVLPVRGARGVIELPAGTIARTGVQEGDVVWFDAAGAGPSA